MAEYQPGACNIGRDEQRRRLAVGVVSFAAAAVFTAWVLATDQPYDFLAVTFVLLVGGFVGYLQYRLRFCVGFAALARYDLAGSGGDSGTVDEREWVRKDRWRAAQIVVASLVAATLLTFGVYFADLLVFDPPRG